MSEIPDDIMAALTSYVLRYGGMCRDCADENGTCPNSGMPCDPDVCRPVVRRTIKALAYGIEHSFIASPFAKRTRALSQLEARAGDVSDQAQFLLDRLSELEWSDIPHDFWRYWNGHVEPAIARLRSALASPSPAPKAEAATVVTCTDILREWFGGDRYARDYKYLDANFGERAQQVVKWLTTPTPAVDADAVIEELNDKIDGLEADLQSAVEVAFRRGATEWVRLNYPDRFRALSLPPSADKGE